MTLELRWIGGVGVVSAARRTRVGETLMRSVHDEARDRGQDLRALGTMVVRQREMVLDLQG